MHVAAAGEPGLPTPPPSPPPLPQSQPARQTGGRAGGQTDETPPALPTPSLHSPPWRRELAVPRRRPPEPVPSRSGDNRGGRSAAARLRRRHPIRSGPAPRMLVRPPSWSPAGPRGEAAGRAEARRGGVGWRTRAFFASSLPSLSRWLAGCGGGLSLWRKSGGGGGGGGGGGVVVAGIDRSLATKGDASRGHEKAAARPGRWR